MHPTGTLDDFLDMDGIHDVDFKDDIRTDDSKSSLCHMPASKIKKNL